MSVYLFVITENRPIFPLIAQNRISDAFNLTGWIFQQWMTGQ